MVKRISCDDELYPALLKKLQNKPASLYLKSNKFDPSIFDKCLGVVGSRRMTKYGEHVVEKFIPEVAAAGVTIVSGFMYGIDAKAHEAAVSVGGKTVAVMACGIDIVTPAYQTELYSEILNQDGAIISEFPRDFSPTPWAFPKRNRIVAGICQSVLVVEAAEASGSLITAGYAKKYRRKILTFPSNVTSKNGLGVLKLLKEGATPVGSAKDILETFKVSKEDKVRVAPTNLLEAKVMEVLDFSPMTINEISRKMNMDFSEISTLLTSMELKGFIKEKEGSYYVS